MLTIKINDSYLEKYIIEKTRLTGKSTQEILKDMLTSILPGITDELHYQKLNPKNYGYYINNSVDEVSNDDTASIFSQVENTEKFTEILRKNAWRKQ